MKFIEKESAPQVKKRDGTNTWYYIFPEYEIHYNQILPGAIQPWHHHKRVEESILVLTGRLKITWMEENKEKMSCELNPGTLVKVGAYPHSVSNPDQDMSTFIVFKFVPKGENLHKLIKNDKVLNQVSE